MKPDLTSIAKAFHSKHPRTGRQLKFYSVETAAECIGSLYKGCEIFCLTKGQFSLFDIVECVLAFTGPADVLISTWTAAGADTKRAKDFLVNGDIRSIRWVVDRSFLSRQPAYCMALKEEFGDCIRTTRTHAKFIIVRNENWHFVIRTSMNLNSNPRIEDFEISEDKDFADFFQRFVDEVFAKIPADKDLKQGDLEKIHGFDTTDTQTHSNIPATPPQPDLSDLLNLL